MTDQTTPPPKQGSPRGAMDPPATPGQGRSARDPTPTLAPSTPGQRDRALIPGTPRASNSPFPTRTPRTPGAKSVQPCTVDESQYTRVTVHTAKCTECDKRNMDTMRRCPGCTFQVCQPCYEKRLTQNKGLLHGNMATPGATGGSLVTNSGSRAVRKKPSSSTSGARSAEKKVGETNKEDESSPTMEEPAPATQKSTAKKRAIKKKAHSADSEAEESSEDDFEPDDTSPTPSKRRRTDRRRPELTFAESALATAIRTPPATRATRRSLPAPTYRAPSSPLSDHANAETSIGCKPSGSPGSDFISDKDLYEIGIKPYKDQPLLARREPVMSSPASRIPDIIKRGGQPRAEDQTYVNIQERLRAKMQHNQAHETLQEETVAHTAEQGVSSAWRIVHDDEKADTAKTKTKAEEDAYPQTVGAFVEKEAARYQNNETLDEDENEAIVSALKNAALVWGKHTYKKLNQETQHMVQPGLKLRLDLINETFRVELAQLMDEHAGRILSGLDVSDDKSVTAPPGQLFKPA